MTYEQTIDYLYKQLPMFSRIGIAAYKKDLHNTVELCNYLNDPQQKFKSIHIAGTNGKGSTSHMLAAIFQEAGYKTGLYTSPHIHDFRERIRLNGKMVEKNFIVDFVRRTMAITEEIKPSFFELTVAMAFDYFANESVDIAIIETGLGGRLDSTNIISPILSVITNIGYDHMYMLGDTLPEIAFEKAGIIKKDTPVVIGETLAETKPVFEKKASEMNAELFFTQEIFTAEEIESTGLSLICDILNKKNNQSIKIETDLPGSYQVKNLCTVLNAVDVLKELDFNIPEAALQKGLANVKKLTGLRGRWEIIQNDPLVILDVAHNEDGINQLLLQLRTQHLSAHIHFVIGFVNDKDITKMLSLFPGNASYYFTNAHIPRAFPFESLKQMAAINNMNGAGFDNVNDAIAAAKLHADKDDVIMVCGSFFIIAEIEGIY